MPEAISIREFRAFLADFERNADLTALGSDDLKSCAYWRRFEAPRWTETLNLLLRDEPKRILNFGPYHGVCDLFLKQKRGLEVVGLDHPEVAARLEGYWRANGLEVQPCDLACDALPVPLAAFDAVLASELIEHVRARPRTVLRKAFDALKPGGTLVVTTPNIARLSNLLHLFEGKNISQPLADPGAGGHVTDHWHHIREYTAREMREETAAAGFAEIETIMSACWDRPGASGERSSFREALKALWLPLSYLLPRLRSCIMIRARKPQA
ncbi:MAG: class I SAM-dependent methyltransferase [Planctomycetes bacterium]|nr:class I SAM-dependent methyltransferase [Planctomycetota bacterium]